MIVTGGPVTVVGPAAAMLALTANQISPHIGDNYLLGVQDTAHDIEQLTPKQITSLAANQAPSLTATDTGLAISETEAVDMEAAGVSVTAPAGATAVLSGAAGALVSLTDGEISALPDIGVSGVVSTSGSVTLKAAQAKAMLAAHASDLSFA